MDDPKMQTRRTQRRPQTVQMSDEEFERFYADIYREFGPAQQNVDEGLTRDIPVRGGGTYAAENPRPASPANGRTAPRNTYADNTRSVTPAKKSGGIRGLVIAVCLECLGIVGVVLWWLLMIL